MDSPASNQRKYRCLVALLIKNKIFTIEEAVARRDLFPSVEFELVSKAVKEAKIRSTPKWEKRVRSLLVDGEWSPMEEPWVDFESLRNTIVKVRVVVYDRACIVASRVEVWTCIKANGYSVIYLRSGLTDETYYATRSAGGWRILEAGSDPALEKTRSPYHGSITAATAESVIKLAEKNGMIPQPPVINVLKKAIFS